MADGNGQLGIIIDERASPDQHQALVSIARGDAGGSLAAVNALVTEYLGIQSRAIRLDNEGLTWTASTEGAVDQVAEGVPIPPLTIGKFRQSYDSIFRATIVN